MPKEKMQSKVHVADGAGGMREVPDLRFELGNWPIEFDVAEADAKLWMAHLTAETEERNWSSSGSGQIDREENSGTRLIYLEEGVSPPSIEVRWEKLRGKELHIRARVGGAAAPTLDLVEKFFDAIIRRQRSGTMLRAHRREILIHNGLPWRGELWLDDDLRLGPPAKFPVNWSAPQPVVVDAMIEGIGWQGVNSGFRQRLHELRVFLSVVIGLHTTINRVEEGWVCELDQQGRAIDSSLGQIGYVEPPQSIVFPSKGDSPAIERRAVIRPGLGQVGRWPDMQERWVPTDIEDLWQSLRGLSTAKREHFLQAGNALLIADALWPDQRTAYAAFHVVACEALKPKSRKYRSANFYDVVESLLGAGEGQRLRALPMHPQDVRSRHLHRGELMADELLPLLLSDSFQDPSFDQTVTELWLVARKCLIEWLRCKGDYNFVFLPRG